MPSINFFFTGNPIHNDTPTEHDKFHLQIMFLGLAYTVMHPDGTRAEFLAQNRAHLMLSCTSLGNRSHFPFAYNTVSPQRPIARRTSCL